MRLGVLGLGAIAPFYLCAIEEEPTLTLTAVCDLDEAKLAPFAAGGIVASADITTVLEEGGVEAVVATLPNDQHAAAVCMALRRGIHVCCEKPLAVTSAEADAMLAAARAGGSTLFTAFHRRYNRNLREFAGRLAAERDRIASVSARYHENILEHSDGDRWYLDPTRCGGGVVIDNGSNVLDVLRHLLGRLTVLDATIGDIRGGSEYLAVLDLATADGIPVRVELDWALESGEIKDVSAELRDGRRIDADLLAGFPGFRDSLAHEYVGVLAAFRAAVTAGPAWPDPGPELVRLVEEVYRVAHRRDRPPRTTPP